MIKRAEGEKVGERKELRGRGRIKGEKGKEEDGIKGR